MSHMRLVKTRATKAPKVGKVANVRLVACVPPDLMAWLEELQSRLRQQTGWQERRMTSVSALVTQALQEFLDAHG
jgi:hypothetical protein